MTNRENLKNTKVLVVGFGRSGIAAAQALLKLEAKVYIQDSKMEDSFDQNLITFFKGQGAEFYLNSFPHDMETFDLLVLSPGVSPELPFIRDAVSKGVEVIGELEIAYRIGKGNYIAITGTNGKTTTTTLVGEIFKLSGRKTSVVGNIGIAVISASADAEENDWLVTECSSFQLETTKYFKPAVSAILNLTPDHLNRHHTMDAYGQAKAKVFKNQSEDGYLVINKDDVDCYRLARSCKAKIVPFSIEEKLPFGAYIHDGKIVISEESGTALEICDVSDVKIIGRHNLANVVAAAAISYFAGIDISFIRRGIAEFGGVEHRIEFCGEINGVKYYNDSKGTNTDAAITAIKAIEKNIILIAGGDAKEQDFSEFAKLLKGKVKTLILLGRDGNMIRDAAYRQGFMDCVYCKNMDECVAKAKEIAVSGDTVLLSPACASWDMYDNYEQRGCHFKDNVARLVK